MAAEKDDDIPALGQLGISSGVHFSFPFFGKRSPAKPQELPPWPVLSTPSSLSLGSLLRKSPGTCKPGRVVGWRWRGSLQDGGCLEKGKRPSQRF